MENLNDKQREAVTHTEGPLLIIAGPGSGKTKTLVERVSYILNNKDVEAKNIFLATFSNKASKELTTRISRKIDANVNLSEMYLGTVHSICHRIIDENLDRSVLNRNYRIFDELEQMFFIYKNMKEFKKIEGYYEFFLKLEARGAWKKAQKLRNLINKINEIDITGQKIDDNLIADIDFLKRVNARYNELLRENNALDFSNLQFECLKILTQNEDVLAKLQNKIKYMMIDEYQDTNTVQEQLFLLIAGKRKNICVVGDDDQAIYRFRGATIRNILEFEKNFEEGECKKIELNRNYRSNKDIVDFCNLWNSYLKWDDYRYNKEVISGKERINQTKGVIKISEESNGRWKKKLKDLIIYLKHIGKIEDYNQIAFIFKSVNVRWNREVSDLMEYFEEYGIPVYSPRSNMFFSRDEIKFIIGLFVMVFPQGREIVLENKYRRSGYCIDCFNFAKRIMKKDEVLIEHIKEIRENFTPKEDENGEDVWENKYPSFLSIFYSLIECGSESINKYFDLEENHVLKNRSTYNLGIFSGILSNFDDMCEIQSKGLEDLDAIIKYFFDVHIKLLVENGIKEYEDMKEYAPKGAVSFLTIHQSKGLEFPFVIVGSLWTNLKKKKPEYQERLDGVFTVGYEPEYRREEFDFWRAYYTAFSRAQNLLALTCVESKSKPVPSIPFKGVYSHLEDIKSDDFKISKLKFEKIKEADLKETLSFTSHISLYKESPKKYKMIQKYKFVQPKNRRAMYGVLVHETLEDMNRKIFAGEEISKEFVEKTYRENYKNLKLSYKLSIDEEILDFGLVSLMDYYKRYSSMFDKIKDIELELSYVHEKYILEGVLDLVVENDGEIEIIDFKTGKRGKSEERYIQQLEIYAYLLSKKYDKKISKGKLYYIGEDEFNKIVEIEFTKERLQNAFEDFDFVAYQISVATL